MSQIEDLKTKIEAERVKLDEMLQNNTIEETYSQSVKLDDLIESYINLTSA